MMTRRRCCCPSSGTGTSGCWTFEDPFTREDSTDVGSDWEEQGGTGGPWQILNNKLSVAATSGIARIYVNDSANRCELERTCAGWGRLRLFDGDTPKSARYVPLSANMQIVVCCDGDAIHASVGAAELITIPATVVSSVTALATGDGDKITCLHQIPSDVGTGTASPDHYLVYVKVTITENAITFDDYKLSAHEFDDPTCPDCRREDCEWFTDVAVPSGNLSDADYTLGPGTSPDNWVYGGGVKATEDGTLQLAVAPPRGIEGAVTFYVPGFHAANDGATVTLYYGDSCGVRLEKSGDTCIASVLGTPCNKGDVYGTIVNTALTHPIVTMCWDGVDFLIEIRQRVGGGLYKVWAEYSPTEFSPRIEVSGLTSGYITFTLVATKNGAYIEPPKTCPTCDQPECGCDCFRGTALLTLTGIANRTTFPVPWTYIYQNEPSEEPPYGMTCPESITFSLTATDLDSCIWSGFSDYVVPHYRLEQEKLDGIGTWSLVRLWAEVAIGRLAVGFLLSIQIRGDGLHLTYRETILDDPVLCSSFTDVPFYNGFQHDFFLTIGDPALRGVSYLLCVFCNSPNANLIPCTSSPIAVSFESPEP